MADVKGMMMGGAGHDAAAIVAALVARGVPVGDADFDEALPLIVGRYEKLRDALLASNESAQSAFASESVPDDPAAVAVNLKAAHGMTIREVYETSEKVGTGSGKEYLTWIVSNLGDSKPALAAAVRKFLEGKASK